MIFASFISSFIIVKSGFTNWPPAGQPRLPVEATAVNSCFLFLSLILLEWAYRSFRKQGNAPRVKKLFFGALTLGILFVAIQGFEWARLIGFGLTLQSSQYGAFFYTIIGGHALHVLAGVIALVVGFKRLNAGVLTKDVFTAMRAFWIFVVAVWPVLYALVYL
jgi:heme/copper-type cytochrome/quinol oxidase subunit 3